MTFARCMKEISRPFSISELNEKAKAKINAIQRKSKKNKLTDEGKECKERIVTKLFYESTLLLNSNLFTSALPLFKSFILTSEQKEPLIHRLQVESIEALLKVFEPFSVVL